MKDDYLERLLWNGFVHRPTSVLECVPTYVFFVIVFCTKPVAPVSVTKCPLVGKAGGTRFVWFYLERPG